MNRQRVWYLNDNVINDYFTLIQNENPHVHSMDTYFYNRLLSTGYETVKRWTKKVDIFSKSKVFFPINITGRNQFAHWILIVADMKKQEVVYYDSLQNHYNSMIHGNIMAYLGLEYRAKLDKSFPVDDWKFVRPENHPVQNNGRDCGVFVCTFAEYLSRDAAFNFNQTHMLSFRKLIAFELMTRRLIRINVDGNALDQEIYRITHDYLTNRHPNLIF